MTRTFKVFVPESKTRGRPEHNFQWGGTRDRYAGHLKDRCCLPKHDTMGDIKGSRIWYAAAYLGEEREAVEDQEIAETAQLLHKDRRGVSRAQMIWIELRVTLYYSYIRLVRGSMTGCSDFYVAGFRGLGLGALVSCSRKRVKGMNMGLGPRLTSVGLRILV